MLDFAKMLAYQPLPRGNKLAIVTGTGGSGVMAVDAAVRAGLEMARLSEETRNMLARLFIRLENNPVDVGPAIAAVPNPRTLHLEAMRNVIADDNVDCAVIAMNRMITDIETCIGLFQDVKQRLCKPIAIWDFGLDLPYTIEQRQKLEDKDIPVYSEIEDAVRALGIAYRYSQIRSRFHRLSPD
jgi:acetyltransferase